MNLYKLKTLNNKLEYPVRSFGARDFAVKISERKILSVIDDLEKILVNFEKYKADFSLLPIIVNFNKLIPKSKRFTRLLYDTNKHITQIDSHYHFTENNILIDNFDIVYAVSRETIAKSLQNLKSTLVIIRNNKESINMINRLIPGKGNRKAIDEIISSFIPNFSKPIDKTLFTLLLLDLEYIHDISVSNFNIERIMDISGAHPCVKFYYLDKDFFRIISILKNRGIEISENMIVRVSEQIPYLNLDVQLIKEITEIFPFLISSANLGRISYDNNEYPKNDSFDIDEQELKRYLYDESDLNDITIGVIDGSFQTDAVWKDYITVVDCKESIYSYETNHGTCVSKLIISNDFVNKGTPYSDGLGKFKVRHFNVIPSDYIDMTILIDKLNSILSNNKDIKI